MSGRIPIFRPGISIVLKKNIGRSEIASGVPVSERFQGTFRTIDLTPFLGERGAVVVSKSIREDSGTFSITLVDRVDGAEGETLYALIEPQDVIEIRMARDASQYQGKGLTQGLPIMMRGLVTAISRPEMMTDAGPVRSVQISGQDYGKILAMCQISYLPNMVTGQLLTSFFNYFANYNTNSQILQTPPEFMQSTLTNVIQPFIDLMRQDAVASAGPGATSPIMDIKADFDRVVLGEISAFGMQQWPGGSIFDMMKFYGDVGPWNELYIEDREDAPYLVYRPNPFKTAGAAWIQEPYISDSSKRPAISRASNSVIVSIEPSRSDMGVANYYWVDSARFTLIGGNNLIQMISAMQSNYDSYYIKDYQNSDVGLYGFRKMEATTQQGPRSDGQKEDKFNGSSLTLFDWIKSRRDILVANNRDNVVFENGAMVLRGDETIRAGNIINVTKGNRQSECYAVRVTHSFAPFGSYTTRVDFERGTDFIVRTLDSRATPPYFGEQTTGGAYGAS